MERHGGAFRRLDQSDPWASTSFSTVAACVEAGATAAIQWTVSELRASNHEKGVHYRSVIVSPWARRVSSASGVPGSTAPCQGTGRQETCSTVFSDSRRREGRSTHHSLIGGHSRGGSRCDQERTEEGTGCSPRGTHCRVNLGVPGFCRSQKRLANLDAERASESALSEEGRQRLARLQAQAAAAIRRLPTPPVSAMSEFEAEVSPRRSGPTHEENSRQRVREVVVPNTVQ